MRHRRAQHAQPREAKQSGSSAPRTPQAFATKFELVRPASARNVSFKEVSLSDPDSGAAAIPRGSSVLFVLDDNIGASRVRTNVQAGVAVLDAAAAARAAEVILVTPIEPNGVPLGGRGNVGKLVAEVRNSFC